MKKEPSTFSISKRRKVAQAIATKQVCPVYCLCKLLEHQGSMMMQCNRCNEWYHSECVNTDTLPTKANETLKGIVPAVAVNYTCMLLNKYIIGVQGPVLVCAWV